MSSADTTEKPTLKRRYSREVSEMAKKPEEYETEEILRELRGMLHAIGMGPMPTTK